MNILIVSNNFSKGGLETHIDTLYNSLSNNNNFIFCFGTYENNNYIKNATIYDKFHFSYLSSINDFIEDIERLIKIIKKHKIDVINVHPFYSIFPAIFAANITNTKIVYTYHGRSSINFMRYPTDDVLFQFAVENIFSKIICVSKIAIPWFNKFDNNQTVYIPNLIDENKYNEHNVTLNKKWALISRLDIDKYSTIIKFLNILPKLDIDKIDIYGSGSMEEPLKKFIKENKLSKKINLCGYNNNLNTSLDNYTGCIGIGRVALECLCMNYPVILIGQDKVIGVIDQNTYNNVKNYNFVPTYANETDTKNIAKQIKEINDGNYKEYQLRKEIIEEFGISNSKNYIDALSNSNFYPINIINDIYNNLKNIDKKDNNFYESFEVYEILYNNLITYTINNQLQVNLNIYNKLLTNKKLNELQIESLDNKIKLELDNINITLNKLENKTDIMNNQISKIGLKYLIKRALKNRINKFKNK